VEFRILGPLEVLDDGRELPLGPAKEQAVLAALLLHPGSVVSRSQLIDRLWGETPPPSAPKAVNVYVSQVRKTLVRNGIEPIVTRPPGYLLAVDTDALDSTRFQRLAASARERERAGELEAAAALMQEALGLWRGPALAGLDLEGEGREDVAHLEEQRLSAQLDLIDYELALGRHEQLVAELDRQVTQHPLDERLRGQLILALYRSGRQAEALQAYRETRETLVDTLGIEPSPALQRLERGILNHDSALQTPTGTAARNVVGALPQMAGRLGSRRRRILLVAAGGAVAIGASVAAIIVPSNSERGAPLTVTPNSLATFDRSGRLVASTTTPGVPGALAATGGSVWLATSSGAFSTVSARTLQTRRVTTPGAVPTQLVPSGHTLWAIEPRHRMLLTIDRVYGTVVHRIALPAAKPQPLADVRMAAAPGGGVWITDGGTHLLRYDGRGELVLRRDLHRPLADVATAPRSLWVLSGAAAMLLERDPRTGAPRGSIRLESHPGIGAPLPVALAAGAGALWVLDASPPSVIRVDPRVGAVTTTIPLGIGSDPLSLAAAGNAVWVADSGDGTLARIDSVDNSVHRTVVGGSPFAVAADRRRVWLTVQPGLVARTGGVPAPLASGAATSLHALPPSICSPVYGEGKPDLLIAADLPLTGLGGSALTLQMSNAIRFVLAGHHYRAGRFAVGYQLCDDSSAQTGSWTTTTCRANARTIAADADVIGMIGPYNSGCAQAELPLLAHARPGPVPTVSPATTYVGLTHRGPGSAPGEPGAYRDGGRPTFARVVAADDMQGAANGMLAKRLGVHRLFLLDDGGVYGKTLAAAVRATAQSLGIRIVGARTWTFGEDKPALARRVAASRPDGVFLGGPIDADGNALLDELHAVLGPDPQILLPDGFMPFPVLLASGIAAEGATITFPGPATSRLPPAGRRFADAFARAIGTQPEAYSIAAAQAAEAMIDAIARSDGTRASVAQHLLHDTITNGILGSFRFDRNGDTSNAAVSVFRITGGQPRLLTVIKPSAHPGPSQESRTGKNRIAGG
jgi:DNA-binding SARP family transcriptional activator/ABC-type branched-subunit amino acid transport system substrate-binding protein